MAHVRLAKGPGNEDAPHKVFSKEIAMKKVVDLLFHKVFADPELRRFFEDITVEALKHKQEQMMEYLFGGPDANTSPPLREYHSHQIAMGLNQQHHLLMTKYFEEVMDELGSVLPAETKKQAIETMRSFSSHFRSAAGNHHHR